MKNKKNNKKRRFILIAIFIIVILSTIALLFYRYAVLQDGIVTKVSYAEDIIHKDFNSNIAYAKKIYAKKIDKLLAIKGVAKAFASKDRQNLYSLVKAQYKQYKEDDPFLKIMTFRLMDGSTFLRVHKPQMYGDKLNKRRTIIMDVNRLHKRLFGFEIGKLQMSYRIVTPIFYKNNYVGLVEIGILPQEFTNNISNVFHIKNALIVKSSDTRVSLNQKKYFQENGFSLISDDPLFKKVFKLSNTEFKDKKSFFYTDSLDGKDYLIENNLYLLNQNKKMVAKILLAYDITSLQANSMGFEEEAVISAVLIVVFIFALLQFFW
ncbi:MAG: hypothetical protein L3J44_00035 [Campylobacteraceae bacterium]|nr:hypothetical protein [Campylobacteraceae bacterium]